MRARIEGATDGVLLALFIALPFDLSWPWLANLSCDRRCAGAEGGRCTQGRPGQLLARGFAKKNVAF